MKGLFKSKPRTPSELIRHVRDLLIYADRNTEPRQTKRQEKISELCKLILEMRTVLYGDGQSEPVTETCAQLTEEFFKGDTLRLLIICLPKLDSGAHQDATHVVANLQRQWVNSRLIASEYMEQNVDLVDSLVLGYEDSDIALSYGALLRDCICHQVAARYTLESEHMKKFFDYIQSPNFDIASDAVATFKELLTRHKSTVADFLSRNYEWFFQEYNSKLLGSPNYITRRHAVKDSNKTIQLNAFQVFQLFVANQNKPAEIVSILITNRGKLLRFFGDFKFDKVDEVFEADKAQVVKEIAMLEPTNNPCADLDKCDIPC
ncbi:putative MO25-like protein At5g47540 isoform X2 [Camellia sinensis]|uniref:putative MO25-like protein At5g47540 isoform X2 n=1 Tax=Camellia sinensis TaxID=4442 RepID=UPI0010361999|nr:putative MO25-like protein At5g47540 isoform X2 [Camellia sinensis]